MNNERAFKSMRQLAKAGGVMDYGPDLSRLLVRVMRVLAQGCPVAKEQIDQIISDLGVDGNKANHFLSQVAERDASGNFVGMMGLSLNATHHHHLYLNNGTHLFAWCAMDTLFLPAVLNQTVTILSTSPVSRQTVRLTISPQKVEAFEPEGVVLSFVVVDDKANINSVESILSTFCCHMHFFASREEAKQWASGQKDIEILSVEEGFELGKLLTQVINKQSSEKQ